MPSVIRDEHDILAFGLEAARSFGDTGPELIQHTTGTREAVTKASGSSVHSDEPSYLIAIRGDFAALSMRFSVLLCVVNISTGRVTDSAESNDYPDLASVGPVVTDYRAGEPKGQVEPDGTHKARSTATPQPVRTDVGKRAYGTQRSHPPTRTDSDLSGFFSVSDASARVQYEGPATVGSTGRAHLHGRNDGIGDLIWEGLAEAGWQGHMLGIRPTIEVCIRVPPPLTPARTDMPRSLPRPGGLRREGERGRIADDGVAYKRYEGPLHVRAVPGIRMVDSERHAEDFDYLEDMLYTAAVRAGWISRADGPRAVAEIPCVAIVIGIARRQP